MFFCEGDSFKFGSVAGIAEAVGKLENIGISEGALGRKTEGLEGELMGFWLPKVAVLIGATQFVVDCGGAIVGEVVRKLKGDAWPVVA